MKKILIPLLSVAAAMPSYGTIILDFSNFNEATSVVTSGGIDTVSYGIVANDGTTDIYARLVSTGEATYYDAESSYSEIRMPVDTTISFKFTLYQDSGYSQIYDPTDSFDWSLMFADLEGTASLVNNAHEKLTIKTTGTYTLANNTFLDVTTSEDGTTFSAEGEGTITNPTNGTSELSVSQSQGAIRYNVTDQAEVEFTYTAVDNSRSAFIYGGSLEFSSEVGTTTTTVTTAVPEPSSTALLGLGGLALILRRRK